MRKNKFRKEFRIRYYSVILEFYRRLKASGIVGSITTAEVISDVKVKTRGETNFSGFVERNIKKSTGETILTPVQYEINLEPTAMAVDFVVWETKRFGRVLTTTQDMKKIIEKELEKIVEEITEDTYMTTIIPQLATEWVWDSTYKDAIGSVYSILSYWDYEADGIVSIYLNGAVVIDNVEQEILTDEEMANHLLGIVRREFENRGFRI